MSRTHYHCPVCGEPTMSGMNCCEHEQPPHSDLEIIVLHQQIENLENDIATLELENKLMRARNERLQEEIDRLMMKLAGPCAAHAFQEGNNH